MGAPCQPGRGLMAPAAQPPPSARSGWCDCDKKRNAGWTRAEGGEWVCPMCHRQNPQVSYLGTLAC